MMNDASIVLSSENLVDSSKPRFYVETRGQHLTFDSLYAATESSLRPATSAIYSATWRQWFNWCVENDWNPLDFNMKAIRVFLEGMHVTKATRDRQLVAIRSLSSMLSVFTPDIQEIQVNNAALEKMKTPEGNLSDYERDTKALSHDEVEALLAYEWDDHPTHLRNRSLMWLAFGTGARRNELRTLKWSDLDRDNQLVVIRHGKGDKHREATCVLPKAYDYLDEWRAYLPQDYEHIFVSMYRGGKPRGDKPMGSTAMHNIAKAVAKDTGISMQWHNARRTFATEVASNRSDDRVISELASTLGHASEETTLKYIKAADARSRKNRISVNYGDS